MPFAAATMSQHHEISDGTPGDKLRDLQEAAVAAKTQAEDYFEQALQIDQSIKMEKEVTAQRENQAATKAEEHKRLIQDVCAAEQNLHRIQGRLSEMDSSNGLDGTEAALHCASAIGTSKISKQLAARRLEIEELSSKHKEMLSLQEEHQSRIDAETAALQAAQQAAKQATLEETEANNSR